MPIEYEVLFNALLRAFYPFVRIGAFLMAAPIFGDGVVLPRFRLLLAVALTAAIWGVLPEQQLPEPFSGPGLALVISELLLGIFMGLFFRLVVNSVIFGAQIIALQMGIGFGEMVDPLYGSQVPLLGQFFNYLAILLLLATGAHLALIEMIAKSFQSMPVGVWPSYSELGRVLVFAGVVFSGALRIAIPIVAILLLINLAFGIMTRAAPQINLFSVGFAMLIPVGFTALLILLPQLLPHFLGYFRDALNLGSGMRP
jgi:flagellar biosynthetic protein FliR